MSYQPPTNINRYRKEHAMNREHRPIIQIQPGRENDPQARANLNLGYLAYASIAGLIWSFLGAPTNLPGLF